MEIQTMEKVLAWSYDKAVNGVPGLDSAIELAEDYLNEDGSLGEKVDSLIRWQNTKAIWIRSCSRKSCTCAPAACRQAAVASMSLENTLQRIVVGLSARAPQIRARCTSDLEEMAGRLPESLPG